MEYTHLLYYLRKSNLNIVNNLSGCGRGFWKNDEWGGYWVNGPPPAPPKEGSYDGSHKKIASSYLLAMTVHSIKKPTDQKSVGLFRQAQ